MTRQDRLRLIEKLSKQYPWLTGVSFGKNQIGGSYKKETVIVFGVEKKLEKAELTEDKMLPSEITFEGTIFKTDVQVQNDKFWSTPNFPPGSREQLTQAWTLSGAHSGTNTGTTATITVAQPSGGLTDVTRITTSINEGYTPVFRYTDTNNINRSARIGSIVAAGVNLFTVTTTSGLTALPDGHALVATWDGINFNVNGGNAPDIPGSIATGQNRVVCGARINNSDLSLANNSFSVGTLGTLAQDATSGAVVGLTNAHVIGTGVMDNNHWHNPTGNTDTTQLNNMPIYWGANTSSSSSEEILGRVWRYRAVTPGEVTTVDAAAIALRAGSFGTGSQRQLGLDTTFNITFNSDSPLWATPTQLDDLLDADNEIDIFTSGQRSGARGEAANVKLRVINSDAMIFIDGVTFTDCLRVAAFDTSTTEWTTTGDGTYGTACDGVGNSGDSGSGVFADFGVDGIRLIGLLFGGPSSGRESFTLCRIDNIATQLNVTRWDMSDLNNTVIAADGTANNLIEVVVAGEQTDAAIVRNISGTDRVLYRAGLTTDATT